MGKNDLAAMGRLGARLDDLARIPSRAAPAAAEGINAAIQSGYENGTDPYGDPWAELAERTQMKHGSPPLQAEFGGVPGPMGQGTIATPRSGSGLDISVPFPGQYHQTGAHRGNWHMPARRILPQGRSLPPEWKTSIDDAMRDAFGKAK